MYLTDKQIEARLDQLDFRSEDETKHPFEAVEQVGPCSVDLRLSRIYWRLRPRWESGRRPIDLGRPDLEELDPRRHWEFVQVPDGKDVRLRPGEMILARTAERFHVPPDCAGAMEGRSSYARLGLGVHPSGGFINPGWSGHFPLPMVNHGKATLKLPPYASVCQVMFVPLGERPASDYVRRGGKYQDDDGGPSYWWRDDALRRLVAESPSSLGDDLVRDLRDAIARYPEDLIPALEGFLANAKSEIYGNANDMLRDFGRSEARAQRGRISLEVLTSSLAVGLLIAAVQQGITDPSGWVQWAGLLLMAIVSAGGEFLMRTTRREYFTHSKLSEIRQRAQQEPYL